MRFPVMVTRRRIGIVVHPSVLVVCSRNPTILLAGSPCLRATTTKIKTFARKERPVQQTLGWHASILFSTVVMHLLCRPNGGRGQEAAESALPAMTRNGAALWRGSSLTVSQRLRRCRYAHFEQLRAADTYSPVDPVPCRTASGPSTLGQLLAAYAYSPVDPLSSSELQKSDFALQLIAADAATHRGCGGPVLVSFFALGREGVFFGR